MPGKIELRFNQHKIAEYPLDREVLTIGRREDNDIRIDNLAVSGYHARILTIFADSFLEDLDSTNGSFINGRTVKKQALRHGDSIVIGKHELRYSQPARTTHTRSERTVFTGGRHLSQEPANAIATSQNALQFARLQILNGRNAGKELVLEKDSVKLGKPGVQVISINRRPDGHFIVALEQTDQCPPLRINGTEIGARTCKLQNHDVIDINELKIEYYLAG